MPATNAKPRAQFAGLHWFATCRGFISSRHRDVCRSVLTGFRIEMSEVSAIKKPPFTHPALPGLTRRLSRHAVCFGYPDRVNPQTWSKAWSLPVRIRYTRNTGRAQQRNTKTATGFSIVGLRIQPEPNRRNSFS